MNSHRTGSLLGRTARWHPRLARCAAFIVAVLSALATIGTADATAASPTVTINPPSAAYETAEITGTVDPGTEEVFVVYAEYRLAGSGEEWKVYENSFAEIPPNHGPTPVSGELNSLLPGTEYEARLDARFFGQGGLEQSRSPEPSPTFTTKSVATPTVAIEKPTAVTAHTARFSGSVNPNAPEEEPVGYPTIAWEFRCTPSCSGSLGGVIAESKAMAHTVEGEAVGLEPGTTYRVTLRATPGNGATAESQTLEFTTLAAPPTIEEESSTSIALTEATLNAIIAPGGLSTTYGFQYLPQATFVSEGWSSTLVRSTPTAVVGATGGAQPVSARVSGLVPGVTYLWRAVATNSVGPTEGSNASFTTQRATVVPSGGCPNEPFRVGFGSMLPDCRAYEQASPIDKNGNATHGKPNYLLVSEDGSSVSFYTDQGTAIEGGEGGVQDFPTYLSSRSGEMWRTQRLLPPVKSSQEEASYLDLTPNARYAFVEATYPEVGRGLLAIDTETGSAIQIVSPADNSEATPSGPGRQYAIDGASADGSVVYFETEAHLLPAAINGVDNLYVWSRATGSISLAGVLPGPTGVAPPGGSFGGAYDWTQSINTSAGGALSGNAVEALHAISPDGNQIFFTAAESGEIYLRRGVRNGSLSTLDVSAPNPGVTDPWVELTGEEIHAAFQEATPDGSIAFFLSRRHLTADATTGPEDGGTDLYRWDAATGTLADVTPDPNAPLGNGAEVVALLGSSEDGNSGYFVARGILPLERARGIRNAAGRCAQHISLPWVSRRTELSIRGDPKRRRSRNFAELVTPDLRRRLDQSSLLPHLQGDS